MRLSKRLAVCLAAACFSYPALAADPYPSRPIKVVVPYAAGGADIYIRPLQETLRSKYNLQLVIAIQTGAGGIIGATAVERSEPDGYTLLFSGTAALTTAPRFQKAEYTIADFQPVIQLIYIPFIIAVRKDAPYQSFKEFLQFARENPGKISYGSTGVGGAPHLAMESLISASGIRLSHIPFTGVAPATVALLGGQIDSIIGAPSSIMPQVAACELKPLVVTSRERFKPTPDIPAMSEFGYDVDVGANFGFFAPKGTAPEIVDTLYRDLADAAATPAYRQSMASLYNDVRILAPKAFTDAVAVEDRTLATLIARLPKQ